MTTKTLRLFERHPLDANVLMQPIALLGNRGSGKTYAGTKLFEAAHELGVQAIAIDPTGKFWSLRLGADGKSPGLKDVYIFGGKRADMPIARDKGALVARAVVEKNLHAVLDISQMRKGERRQFCADFFEELFLLKKASDNPGPSVLFLEEAHALCPQKPQPDEARMLGAVEDLVREGRNCGVGVVVMDQRPATVNKNVLALTEALIVLRTTWPVDRKVYIDWIVQKVGGDSPAGEVNFDQELPKLQAGAGFFYWPVESEFSRVQVVEKKTYDASATVKIGGKRHEIGKLSPVDVEGLRSALGEAAQQLEADDPKALKRRIAQLKEQCSERSCPECACLLFKEHKWRCTREGCFLKGHDLLELARKGLVPAAPKSISIAPELKMLEKHIEKIAKYGDRLAQSQQVVVGALDNITTKLKTTADFNLKPLFDAAKQHDDLERKRAAIRTMPVSQPIKAHVLAQRMSEPINGDETNIGTGERAILAALAIRHPEPTKKDALGTMAGYPARKSTFRAYTQRLKQKGLIDTNLVHVFLTEAGMKEAQASLDAAPRTPAERVSFWRSKLPAGELALFDVLLQGNATHGPWLDKASLGEAAGYPAEKSTFRAYLQRLGSKGIIEKHGENIRAAEEFFA